MTSYPVDHPSCSHVAEDWPSSLLSAKSLPVLQHKLRKPFCGDDARSYFAQLVPRNPEEGSQDLRVSIIGDRLLTDVVFGNFNGWISILTAPLDPSRDQISVKISRWLEERVYRWKFSNPGLSSVSGSATRSGRLSFSSLLAPPDLFTELRCEEFGTASYRNEQEELSGLLSGCGRCGLCLPAGETSPRHPSALSGEQPSRRFSSTSLSWSPSPRAGRASLNRLDSSRAPGRSFGSGSGGYVFSSFDNREGVKGGTEEALFAPPPPEGARKRQISRGRAPDQRGRSSRRDPRRSNRTAGKQADRRWQPHAEEEPRKRSVGQRRGRPKRRPRSIALVPPPLAPGEVVTRCRLAQVDAFTAFGVIFRLVLDTEGQILGDKVEISHDNLDNMPMYLGDIIPLWETREVKAVRTKDKQLQVRSRNALLSFSHFQRFDQMGSSVAHAVPFLFSLLCNTSVEAEGNHDLFLTSAEPET